MTQSLKGKAAVVTGSTSGIGQAMAQALAAQGVDVMLNGFGDPAAIETARMALEASTGVKVLYHPADMTKPDQIADLVASAHREFGRLDILVNNAAANPYFGPVVDTDLTAFQKTVDVNIRGYFFMSSYGAKAMAKNGGGAIVNVASVNGVIPGVFQGIYSITKAAVISMTKTFAKECAPIGVRVNALLPGATDTKFASTLVKNPAILEKALEHIPMNRIAQPDEMAGAILYLASPAASYTTGTCLNVDGGYLLA